MSVTLSNEEVEQILELRKQGKSYREIADETGHSKTTVQKYCNNPPEDLRRRHRTEAGSDSREPRTGGEKPRQRQERKNKKTTSLVEKIGRIGSLRKINFGGSSGNGDDGNRLPSSLVEEISELRDGDESVEECLEELVEEEKELIDGGKEKLVLSEPLVRELKNLAQDKDIEDLLYELIQLRKKQINENRNLLLISDELDEYLEQQQEQLRKQVGYLPSKNDLLGTLVREGVKNYELRAIDDLGVVFKREILKDKKEEQNIEEYLNY